MHSSKRDSGAATAIRPSGPEQGPPDPDPWSFFDRIYCISLKNREDRRREARRQFESVGLADRVEFFLAEKHPRDCEQGIYESHIHCLARGVAAGAEQILIFEDDVIFQGFSPAILAEALTGLRREENWQVISFGCMVKRSFATGNRHLRRVSYRSLTHAYAVRREFAEAILALGGWQGVAWDDLLRDLNSTHMYSVYPSFAFQSDAASDNDVYLPLDRFRRLCGGLRRLQRGNELCQRYRAWIIAGHLLTVLLVWALVLR